MITCYSKQIFLQLPSIEKLIILMNRKFEVIIIACVLTPAFDPLSLSSILDKNKFKNILKKIYTFFLLLFQLGRLIYRDQIQTDK